MKTVKRRLASAVLAGALLLGGAPVTLAYSDTADSWAADVIEKAKTYGLMEGYADGRFGVGKNMKRSEFVTVLYRMMGWTDPGTTGSFTDTAGQWYAAYVEAAAAHGAVDKGGTFRPEDYISREEMAVMLVRAMGYGQIAQVVVDETLPFDDVTDNRAYISMAFRFGIITGVDTNGALKFLPDDSAPREQAAAMLVRAYERIHSKMDWFHGFYADSSYSQIDYTDSLDGVSVGWARMELDAAAGVFLNETSANGNGWVKPQGAQELVLDRLAGKSIPCNLSVFASAATFAGVMSGGLQQTAIGQLVAAAAPYAGLTIDFEGMKVDQRTNFAAFMTALRAALPAAQKLYVCVPPDKWYTGFDYRALGDVCDKVILMAHDYASITIPENYVGTDHTDYPVTPIDEIYTALNHITDPNTGVRDKGKIALAISFNTAGFHVDETGKLADATLYHPAKDTINKRLLQADSVRVWDEAAQNPYLTYTTEDGGRYKLWYEDAQSVTVKLDLARMFGISGVSVWRVGTIPQYGAEQHYNVWDAFQAQRK